MTSGEICAYNKVVWWYECPSNLEMIVSGTPLFMSKVAKVCRRLWNLFTWTFSFLQKLFHFFCSLFGEYISPSLVKINSELFLLSINFIKLSGTGTVLIEFFDFGSVNFFSFQYKVLFTDIVLLLKSISEYLKESISPFS